MKSLLPLVLLSVAVLPAQAVFVDFSNSSDLSLFTEGGISGGVNWSYSTADGVGTPDGAAAIAGSTEQLHYTAQTFNIAGGSTWISSIYVNGMALSGQSASTGSTLIAIGFLTQSTGNFAITDTGSIGLYARVNNTTVNNYQLQFINKPTTANGTALSSSTSFNLTADNWYKLTLTLTETSTGIFSYSTTFEDYGADGVSAPVAVVAPVTGSGIANAATASDTTLYAGTVSRPFTGTGYIDNFSVVPEPSTVALLATTGLFLLRRHRRPA